MNEQLLLEHIRLSGPYSRADLARVSGLSKPTVSLALANLERAALVREAGQRTGVPGRSALLYEVRPDAGFVLGLDIGHQYLRGALADLSGEIRIRSSRKASASSVSGRVAELSALADDICAEGGITRDRVTQTVIGSPGVYDPRRDAMALTGGMPGWNRPAALAGLREAFGPGLAMENDVDAEALAERAHGHGQDADNFAFVHVGSGIGMGLVHRRQAAPRRARRGGRDRVPAARRRSGGRPRRGPGAGACLRRWPPRRRWSGRHAGRDARPGLRAPRLRGGGARRRPRVGGRSRGGAAGRLRDLLRDRGGRPVADRPRRRHRPGPGFAEAVTRSLRAVAPVLPEVKVSALGTDAVVDGCLAEGTGLAWRQLTSTLLAAT